MNELQIFSSEEFGNIRTVTIDNEPWFVGKDVAEALGYQNGSRDINTHVLEEDRKILTTQNYQNGTFEIPNRGLSIINESGLYALIFGSKLESARRFKHWVTREVLPAIRKSGVYHARRLTPEEMLRIELGMIDKHEERISNLESNMVIDYGQQRVLEKEVSKVVIDALGGKNSNAYRDMGKKVFAECNRDVKDYFSVNSRNNIPKLKYESAIEYIRKWVPCTNTRMQIQECNNQMTFGGDSWQTH